MRHLALALAAGLALAAAPTARSVEQRDRPAPVQLLFLQASAGDDSVAGTADLAVTRERAGFRLRGYVEADRGCVELRAVNMHIGMYFGHDTVQRTCRANQRVAVDAFTHHTDVVLTAIVDGGPDWDSRLVTLTGGEPSVPRRSPAKMPADMSAQTTIVGP